MPLISIGQERVIIGIVVNSFTKKAVENVKVSELKFGNSSVTDSTGYFRIELPKKSRVLIFSNPDYFTFHTTKRSGTSNGKKVTIPLKPLNFKEIDTVWKSYKNALSLSINEFMTGAVAVRYERFLEKKHSIGLHTSIYLYGFNNYVIDQGDIPMSYKGFKLAPFYRFYMVRSNDHGFFIEGKIPIGYFNFSTLTYSASTQRNFPQSFWTIGGTLAVGWMFRLGHSLHGVGNLSLGYQFFPMDIPTNFEIEQGAPGRFITYTLNNAWWYVSGPGSVIEIKFTLGGIF